ncbi:MAG TPA: hypothetical protein VF618_21930 [Thermoanaerobaculia bacterium]
MTEHFSEAELWDLASASQASSQRARLHFEACESCRALYESFAAIDAGLRERDVWAAAEHLRVEGADSALRLRQFAARLDAEREDAARLLQPVLISPAEFERHDVVRQPSFQTAACVEILCNTAEQMRERRPSFALALATTAATIAGKLERTPRTLGLRARAELERGIALGMTGKFAGAEAALERSAAALDEAPLATDWEYACVGLARGVIYSNSERYDEAIGEAAAAAAVFREAGDMTRYLKAQMVVANVDIYRNRYADATIIAQEIVAAARHSDDVLLLAQAHHTAALCYSGLNECDTALDHYAEAATRWDELGLTTECVRVEWAVAALLVRQGHMAAGIEQLALLPGRFAALGMINDAALASLDLAEALILAGRASDVPLILSGVIVTFSNEGLMRSANLALAYLREAAGSNDVSADKIRHVRDYLAALPTHPGQRFEPLR